MYLLAHPIFPVSISVFRCQRSSLPVEKTSLRKLGLSGDKGKPEIRVGIKSGRQRLCSVAAAATEGNHTERPQQKQENTDGRIYTQTYRKYLFCRHKYNAFHSISHIVFLPLLPIIKF